MPKVNMYQSLHTTVIGPQGKPLEIQVRTQEMHQTAEFGIAAHWLYKEKPSARPVEAGAGRGSRSSGRLAEGCRATPASSWRRCASTCSPTRCTCSRPRARSRASRPARRRSTSPTRVHTDVGHRCVGAKVNGRIVPLHYTLKSGDFVEILTSKQERGPSRDWLNVVKTSRARNKIRQWFSQRAARGSRAEGPRFAPAGAQVSRFAAPEGHSLSASGRDHPRYGLQEGRRLLCGDRGRQGAGRPGREQAARSAEDRRGRLSRAGAAARHDARPSDRPHRPTTASWSRVRRMPECWCAWPSAAHRFRATRSADTSRWAGASRFTVMTVPMCAP